MLIANEMSFFWFVWDGSIKFFDKNQNNVRLNIDSGSSIRFLFIFAVNFEIPVLEKFRQIRFNQIRDEFILNLSAKSIRVGFEQFSDC